MKKVLKVEYAQLGNWQTSIKFLIFIKKPIYVEPYTIEVSTMAQLLSHAVGVSKREFEEAQVYESVVERIQYLSDMFITSGGVEALNFDEIHITRGNMAIVNKKTKTVTYYAEIPIIVEGKTHYMSRASHEYYLKWLAEPTQDVFQFNSRPKGTVNNDKSYWRNALKRGETITYAKDVIVTKL